MAWGGANRVVVVALATGLVLAGEASAQPAPDPGTPSSGAPNEAAFDPPGDSATAPEAAPEGGEVPVPEGAKPTPGTPPPPPPAPAPQSAPPEPQPAAPAPSPAPVMDAVNEDPTLAGAEETSARFYLALMAFGTLYGHAAIYEIDEGEQTGQTLGGLGYELATLIGGVGKELAIGGAVDFLHVPRAVVSFRDGRVPGTTLPPSQIPDQERSTWILMVGPGIDYRPGQTFRIGGTLGVAISRVPSFAYPSKHSNTLGGFGSSLWVGADWPVGTHDRFGFLIKGAFQQYIPRNLDAAIDPYNGGEVSLSLGVGIGLSFL